MQNDNANFDLENTVENHRSPSADPVSDHCLRHTDCYRDAHSFPYRYCYAETNRYRDADCYRDTHVNGDADAYAHAHADCYPHTPTRERLAGIDELPGADLQ